MREIKEIKHTSHQSEDKFHKHFGLQPCKYMGSCTWMKTLLQLQILLHIHSQNLAHFESANHRESRYFIYALPSHQIQNSEKKIKYMSYIIKCMERKYNGSIWASSICNKINFSLRCQCELLISTLNRDRFILLLYLLL